MIDKKIIFILLTSIGITSFVTLSATKDHNLHIQGKKNNLQRNHLAQPVDTEAPPQSYCAQAWNFISQIPTRMLNAATVHKKKAIALTTGLSLMALYYYNHSFSTGEDDSESQTNHEYFKFYHELRQVLELLYDNTSQVYHYLTKIEGQSISIEHLRGQHQDFLKTLFTCLQNVYPSLEEGCSQYMKHYLRCTYDLLQNPLDCVPEEFFPLPPARIAEGFSTFEQVASQMVDPETNTTHTCPLNYIAKILLFDEKYHLLVPFQDKCPIS